MGVVLNNGTGAVVMARAFLADMKAAGGWPSVGNLRGTARDYARFPIYSTWEALANSMAIQIPILLVASLTNEAELGQLMLAMNVVQAPLALFGTATAQVYLSQAPEKARNDQLAAFTQRTVIHLLRIGIPFMAAVALLAPLGFPILFGPDWARAGVLAAWMAPWLLLQFAYGPVSMAFHILGRQRLALALQIGGLALRAGLTLAGGLLLAGRAGEFFALSGAAFYGMAIMVILISLRGNRPTNQ
jgi:O-antigen/teichoic acid export membrane protein